jgi:hypothetical protein
MRLSHKLFYMEGLVILFSAFYMHWIEHIIEIMDAHKCRARAVKTRPEANHTPVPSK